MSRKLVVSDGSHERELMLVGRLVVGRDPACDITYDDGLLSRRHAEFVTAGDQVTVRDLGSRNGVFVNGAKIVERTLRAGDVVQIGPVRARFVADDVPVSIAPDEVDADHTAVIHRSEPVVAWSTGPMPVAAPGLASAVAAAPPRSHAYSDDDERTRVTPGPRPMHTPGSGVRPMPAPPEDDDDDRTQFLKSPPPGVQPPSSVQATPASTPTVAAPLPLAPAADALSASDASQNSLSTYVFVQVLMLAVIVLAAAAVPLLMWRRDVPVDSLAAAPLVWLTVPVGVALIAAYWIGSQINRRFVHALAAVERKRS